MLLALLIFLPTIIFFPHFLYSFGVLYIPQKIKFNFNLLLIILIILLSFLNQLFNYNTSIIYNKSFLSFTPYYFFILITYYISQSIYERTIKYIILFIIIETIVALFEFFYNVQTFFPNIVTTELTKYYGYKGLLYYSRVFGLSNNSSELAYKIFIALLLLDTVEFKRYIRRILYIVLFLGIFVTFNRSVILSLSFFYFIKITPTITQYVKLNLKKIPKIYLVYILFILIIFILIIFYFNYFILQFTRGISFNLDTFKRNEIYNYFYHFILTNPLFGNGSFKLFYLYQNKFYHAHNSFLQIIATNGFIISILYFTLLFRNINKNNFKYIISIVVLSLTQYAIFWGISILDIFTFYFLFNYKNTHNE